MKARGMTVTFLACVLATMLLCTPCFAHDKDKGRGEQNRDDPAAIGIDAYIYGYPLITMEYTRRVMTNAEGPDGAHAPMGRFARLREYPPASNHDVTAPNADTLYTLAWLDVGK